MKQVEVGHYDFCEYMTLDRWCSLWYQISEVIKSRPDKVLEIGHGTGIFQSVSKSLGLDVCSLDIDVELKPTYVGSVLELPFPDNSFDVVCCFQVLEHLPYVCFSEALKEIARVSKKNVIISLPDAKKAWPCTIQLPRLGVLKWLFHRPYFKLPEHAWDGQHYWEINSSGHDIKKIRSEMKASGINIMNTYRVHEKPYHRFFIAEIININAES